MNFPEDLRYTKEHEWVRPDGGSATVGISAFAQEELGEVVFVDLPAVGKAVKKGETLCVVESTKAASDVYAPVSGTVAAVNSALTDSPSGVNSSPYGEGWMVKLDGVPDSEVSGLMDASAYKAHVGR